MARIRKEIKDFVEKYNQRMDWNQDILDKLNIESKQLFKDYLATTKLNEDTCDLQYAKYIRTKTESLRCKHIPS